MISLPGRTGARGEAPQRHTSSVPTCLRPPHRQDAPQLYLHRGALGISPPLRRWQGDGRTAARKRGRLRCYRLRAVPRRGIPRSQGLSSTLARQCRCAVSNVAGGPDVRPLGGGGLSRPSWVEAFFRLGRRLGPVATRHRQDPATGRGGSNARQPVLAWVFCSVAAEQRREKNRVCGPAPRYRQVPCRAAVAPHSSSERRRFVSTAGEAPILGGDNKRHVRAHRLQRWVAAVVRGPAAATSRSESVSESLAAGPAERRGRALFFFSGVVGLDVTEHFQNTPREARHVDSSVIGLANGRSARLLAGPNQCPPQK